MTKDVKKLICDSLQGGASILNMDLTSDGLSWVKDICQRLETSCDEYVDACNKYVHSASDHIVKIYEEVRDWENQHLIEGPDSCLDLKHDTITRVPDESSGELVNNSTSEKSSVCDHKLPTVSIIDDSDLIALSSEPQARSHAVACDEDNKEPLSTGDIYGSVDSNENSKETSVTFTLFSNTSSSRCDCDQLLESHHDGRLLVHSVGVPPNDANGTFQNMVGSCRNDCDPQVGPYKLGTARQFQEKDVAEVSDGKKIFTSRSDNMLIQYLQTEEFEGVMLDDFQDDALEYEIASISDRADKNTSFKKKLLNAFMSRKGHKRANVQYNGNDLRAHYTQASPSPFGSSGGLCLKPSSSWDSIESEWELL